MDSRSATHWLFSYGTLQTPEVQVGTFGRLLDGHVDALRGYVLVPLQITDPRVVELSGADVHAIACETANTQDRIPGVRYKVTSAELDRADEYEVDAYARVKVNLASGQDAWVYVGPPICS